MRVILHFGFLGVVANGIRIKYRGVPELTSDNNGYIGIAEIIYHVVRCGLVQECSLDQRIEFVKET